MLMHFPEFGLQLVGRSDALVSSKTGHRITKLAAVPRSMYWIAVASKLSSSSRPQLRPSADLFHPIEVAVLRLNGDYKNSTPHHGQRKHIWLSENTPRQGIHGQMRFHETAVRLRLYHRQFFRLWGELEIHPRRHGMDLHLGVRIEQHL